MRAVLLWAGVTLALLFFKGGAMRLISDLLEPGQKSSINQVLDEIQMVCMNQFRAAYELFTSDDFCQGTVENLLFVTLGMWDKLSDEISGCFEDTKKEQSIFNDHRFWEYVAQLKIDKHDPADILEAWLKEHNPEYFEDTTESTETGIAESAENGRSRVAEYGGTIYKRGQTYWIKYYDNGKPIFESSKSKLKMVAVKLLQQREGDISKGKIPGVYFDKVTFDELAEDFLRDYRINKRKSIARAEISANQLKKKLEGYRVPQITTPKIKEYIEQRVKDGAAGGTVNRELSALKRISYNLPFEVRGTFIPEQGDPVIKHWDVEKFMKPVTKE